MGLVADACSTQPRTRLRHPAVDRTVVTDLMWWPRIPHGQDRAARRDPLLIRKLVSYWAPQAAPGGAFSGAGLPSRWSGGGLEGDGVAEGFEPADVVLLAAFGVDALGVVAGSEVVEAGVGV